MHKKDNYVYPAIFNYDDDGISIKFPDLPGCFSCGFSAEEAVHNAREALGLHLFNMEDDKEPIPEPSDILSVKHEANQAVVYVDVFMPRVRDSINNKSVTKAVTVPQWLLNAGREADINFSQTLQDALMEKLGIHRKIKRRQYKNKKSV